MTPDTRNDILIPRQQLLDAQEATKKCRDTLSEMLGELGARNTQICALQEDLAAAKRRIEELENMLGEAHRMGWEQGATEAVTRGFQTIAKKRIEQPEAAKTCNCAICRAEKDHGQP